MTKTRRTLYVDEQMDRAIARMSQETARREDIETRSESQIYRDLLRQSFENSDEIDDLLDKADLILQRREQYIEREARLNSLRVGFEARVRQHLKARFEEGIREEQVETFAAGLKEDARILWPDDEERRKEAIEYVEQASRAMRDAMSQTDYDPLDPADHGPADGRPDGQHQDNQHGKLPDANDCRDGAPGPVPTVRQRPLDKPHDDPQRGDRHHGDAPDGFEQAHISTCAVWLFICSAPSWARMTELMDPITDVQYDPVGDPAGTAIQAVIVVGGITMTLLLFSVAQNTALPAVGNVLNSLIGIDGGTGDGIDVFGEP